MYPFCKVNPSKKKKNPVINQIKMFDLQQQLIWHINNGYKGYFVVRMQNKQQKYIKGK